MASLPGLISLYTPNLLLALFGTDPIQAENMIILDAAIAGLSGHPGGTTGQVQYNFAGVFGGILEGTAGQVLTSNGVGIAPSFQASGSAPVLSVFGRVGAVVAQTGDYTYAQISGTPQLAVTFAPVANEFVTGYSAVTGLFTAAQPSYANISGTPQLPITFAAVAHEWLNSYSSVTGLFTATQPAYTDISGTPQLAQTFAAVTNEFLTGYSATTGLFTAAQPSYANISGTPQLPVTIVKVAHEWLDSYSSVTGLFTQSQPAYTDISGTPQLAQTFAAVSNEWLNSYSATTGLFTATQPSAANLSNGTTGTGAVVLASAISGFGSGTVTSVSFTGGLISVATPTTTPALTVAGTSGGIPYFSSASTWATSAAQTANSPILGGGAATAPSTKTFLTTNGSTTLTIGVAGGGNGILALAGTTSGTATLTAPAVAGTSTNAALFSNSLQLPSGTVLSINGDSGISRLAADSLAFGNGTAGDFSAALKFGTLNATSNAQSMIGTIAFITGASAASSSPSIRSTGASGQFVLNSGGANQILLNFDSGTGGVIFGNGAGAVVATVDGSGNFTGPLFTGTLGFSANGTLGVTAGNFTAVTSITTKFGLVTVLSGTSDERLKIAEPYEGGLDAILAIHPVRYRWNAKGQAQTGLSGEQDFVGFIAQDVQKAIPEAITATEPSKTEPETYLSLDDRPIIAALVDAVKTLAARIAVLEGRA